MIQSTSLYNSSIVSRLNGRSTTLESIAGLAASGSGNIADSRGQIYRRNRRIDRRQRVGARSRVAVAGGRNGADGDQRVAVDIVLQAAQFLADAVAQQGGASSINPDAALMRGMLTPLGTGGDTGNSASPSAPEPALEGGDDG